MGCVTKVPWLGKAKLGHKERNGSPHPLPMYIAETKQKAILMVPIAFTTDHIETLDEIDIEFRGYADEVVDHFAEWTALTWRKSLSIYVPDL